MTQGLTGAVTGAASRQANTASTANMTLPAAPMVATYPITGVTNITSITAGQSGKIALLEFASTGCRVVMGGNLLINGDYLSTANGFLVLVANGSNWEEVDRTTTVIQPYNAHPNGGFELWQRGTSFVGIANDTFFADRWKWEFTGTAVVTVALDTSAPTVAANAINSPYSAKVSIPTTPDTSIAAGDWDFISTTIEGFDYRSLTNGMALSFWCKAHRPGTYCIGIRNSGFDRYYIIEYTINSVDTWEYKTVVIPAPPTAGTWNYGTGVGLRLEFVLAAGSSLQSTPLAWQTGNFIATANQINGVAATTDTFSLWGVNLVPGTVPQPYNPMPITLQLQRLYRYCHVFGGRSGSTVEMIGHGQAISATQGRCIIELSPPMLSAPSMTLSAQTDFNVWDAAATSHQCVGLVFPSSTWNSPERVMVEAQPASGLVAGQIVTLFTNLSTARMIFEANPA